MLHFLEIRTVVFENGEYQRKQIFAGDFKHRFEDQLYG